MWRLCMMDKRCIWQQCWKTFTLKTIYLSFCVSWGGSFIKFLKNVCPTNAASCVDESVVAFVSPLPLCFLAVDWTLHENTPETSLSPDLPSWSMTEAVKGGHFGTLMIPVRPSQWETIWWIEEGHTHCCSAGERWHHLLRLGLQSHWSWWRSCCHDRSGATRQRLSVWVWVGGQAHAHDYRI